MGSDGGIMTKREKLADIAKKEAQKGFHGFVMTTAPNIQPITELFPPWKLENWDGKWCAAFVYYCCVKAGFNLPVRHPSEHVTCNFAGCVAWEQWAALKENDFYYTSENNDFTPAKGDIVLYDNVFCNGPHDHIGIVLENKENFLVVAEGNFNNVSAIVERQKDCHIRGYIRIPDHYDFRNE